MADGNLWTSAGMSASLDLAVGMIERDHGRKLAQTMPRWLATLSSLGFSSGPWPGSRGELRTLAQ